MSTEPVRPPLVAKNGVESRSAESRENGEDLLVVRRRVVDPEGKPVAGAKVYLLDFPAEEMAPELDFPAKEMSPQVRAISAADGRFDFAVPKGDVHLPGYHVNHWQYVAVLAVADGYGPAWGPAFAPEDSAESTLRLGKDDMPIRGRILDLQGKPIAGVTIRVQELSQPLGADLAPWLETLQHDKNGVYATESKFLKSVQFPKSPPNSALARLFPAVTTGADGRFELKGIGRERLAGIRIEGPTIVTKEVRILTRPAQTITAVGNRNNPQGWTVTYYGATFDHYAAPTKPIVGIVSDKDTGKPLAGVTIRSHKWAGCNVHYDWRIHATTDAEGRYQLLGMPKGNGNIILAQPPEGQPYLLASKDVGDSPGLEPITVDFALKRGVLIKGRVTDKATGKPVSGHIEYGAFWENAYRNDVPNWTANHYLDTHEDGSFEVVGLPGRGLLAVRAWIDHYISQVGADQIEGRDEQGFYRTYPSPLNAFGYHTLAEVNPPKDAESLTCNLIVDPGQTLTGKVLGPDDKPLSGARPFGLESYSVMGYWARHSLKTADFTVHGLTTTKPRNLMFVHEGLRLAGSRVVRGDEQGPITVKLQPWATITGRLITADGLPRADVEFCFAAKPELDLGIPPKELYHPDKDGRFRIEGLVPGLRYSMRALMRPMIVGDVFRDLILKPGETKDLGDVELKPQN